MRGRGRRRRGTGTDYLTAMVGLVARSKRRYGGYIVHLGIVLMFFGFTGEAFKIDEQVLLKPGQQAKVGHYVRPQRRRADHRRRPEADDHRAPDGVPRRQGDRQGLPGQVALPQARAGAGQPGGHPPQRGGRPLHRHAGLRPAGPVGDAAGRDQPAGGLDLGGLRRPRARDDARAAARAGVRLRHGASCRRRRRTAMLVLMLVAAAGGRGLRRSTWRTPSSSRSSRSRRSRRTSTSPSSACAARAAASWSASARAATPPRCAPRLRTW